MSVSRGRGYAVLKQRDAHVTELRRPGEAGLKQRFGNSTRLSSPIMEPSQVSDDPYTKICDKIGQMNLSSAEEELNQLGKDITILCNTSEKLEKFVDSIFQFALKSKWNAHAVALFCDSHGDLTADQTKVRTLLLRKLQVLYKERNKAYLEQDKFLLDVTFACEIFHHVRIDGIVCLQVLARPVVDYLGMLVDGASEKEIEVFVEQFPKCYKNLKANDSGGLEQLVAKIRKQLVNQSTTITVRAMLLEIFELLLTDWKPLDQSAKYLYESLKKPIVRICS